MKRLLLAAIALAGLTTAAAADDWKEERRYRYNGQPVKVWTSTKSEVEIRYIPGSRRHGGLGFVCSIVNGRTASCPAPRASTIAVATRLMKRAAA